MNETECLAKMKELLLLLGTFDYEKSGGLPPSWFLGRRIFVDFRGDLRLRDTETMTIGWGVKMLTASHDFSIGTLGPTVYRKCWIDQGVFVGSFSLLYNCWLQDHAVVACGSVVRNLTVPPYTMAEGNPARLVRRFVNGQWETIERNDDGE